MHEKTCRYKLLKVIYNSVIIDLSASHEITS